MSAAHDARVSITFAEYIGLDSLSRLAVVGGGISWVVIHPTGLTGRVSVCAAIDFPASSAGTEVPVLVELRDETLGKVVTAFVGGSEEAVRVQQLVPLQKASLPGVSLPTDMPIEHRVVLDFGNGLLLKPGHHYAWRVEVEGQHLKGWECHFWALTQQPAPVVFGGQPDPDPDPNMPSL